MKSSKKNLWFIVITFFLFIKIIFYYFFSGKIGKLKQTIIEFLIMLSKTKSDSFYNENFINRKIVKNENKVNDLAILIPCQLRCWDQSKDLIISLAEKHHVFIFTDPEYSYITDKINNTNIHICFSDNKKYSEKKKYILDSQLHQWFKLHCIIQEVYSFEKKNRIFFKTFLKIRTDYGYLNQNQLVNINREMKENCLFARSDITYSGKREFVLPLGNFFESASQVLSNYNNKFMPICTSQIINSDYDSYRLHWLKYPKKIINKINHKVVLSAFNVKQIIEKNESKILEMNKNLNNQELTNDSDKDKFSSEQIFARYLNINNITCKAHEKFAGALLKSRMDKNK